MTLNQSIRVGLLSLTLAGSALADTQVVDVNRHIIPPGPPHARHVIVVNSAEHARRHHGVAGAFQRLHIWHMRQRAKVYKTLYTR